MRNKILITLALVALGAWGVSYYLRPLAVVEPVVRGLAVNPVPGSVTAVAEYQADLKSEISGRILRSELELGRSVKKGDFLLALDSGDLQLEIERLESDFAAHKRRVEIGSSLKLELEVAREDLANKKGQVKFGVVSEADITRLERLLKQVEQRIALEKVANDLTTETYENRLKVQRRQLAKMTFVAEFDGVISAIYARPGDLIGGNSTIATIISTSRNVEAKVSEENFAGIRVGQKASVRFLGYGAQTYKSEVVKILPTADPETQRYIVHLSVDLPVEKLVPGLTGEVSIVVAQRANQMLVPRRALRGNQIMVVSGGRVEVRKVEVGFIALNLVEILNGLKDGEQVLVEDLDLFRDGDRVRLKAKS
jgi:RND family efflux transporter MFP subunit